MNMIIASLSRYRIYRVRALLSLFVLLLFVWEWSQYPPHGMLDTILALVAGSAIALTIPFPIPASCCIFVVDILVTMLSGSGPTTMWASLLAIGLIAYHSSAGIICATVVCACLAQYVMMQLPTPRDVGRESMFFFGLMFFFAAFAGRALHWREEAFQHRLQTERFRHREQIMEANNHAAQEIHDSVTGDLSLIARTAQRQIRIGSQEREQWEAVERYAMEALTDVHRVIEQLASTNDDANEQPRSDVAVSIRRLIDDNEQRLHDAGFNGRCTFNVDDDAAALPDGRRTIAIGLIREIYANIIRHGNPNESYELSVVWNVRGIEITECNTVASQDDLTDGHGIVQYRQSIERIGGVLDCERNGGEWVTFAQIPA
ncbi:MULTISPECIES: sensor histidine kinase [Bifidobacterium]|uniref:sensor histidine kinase n=1 Tax=Bifidobacterium TaxID=1678 RepID=UPI001BDBFBE8|nr:MULTISPECIES: hypothetical protein [Bifidobacterium]MBT1162639.1 hypothetical protein [Bifidobacterium sp. SO1]MBW3077926.1 hypothetical protein [Bifidobacterium simiiventris]